MAFPLIAGGAALLGGFLQSRAAGKAEKAQRAAENEYAARQDAARQQILSGLQARGYDPFGPQTTAMSQTGGGTQFGRTVSDEATDMLTRPEISAAYGPMESKLRELVMGRLGAPTALPAGYVPSAVRAINKAFAPAQQELANRAARTGGQVPLGGALSASRAGQIADLVAGVPLKERELQTQDIGLAQGLTEAFGKGQRQTGTRRGVSTTSGTTSSFGSSQQTGGPDISALMTLMAPTGGPRQTMQTGQSTVGSLLSGAAPLIGALEGKFGKKPPVQTLQTRPLNNFLY